MTSIERTITLNTNADACLVCFHENLHFQRAITPCGHDGICSQCHMRLRRLHQDKKCPICKTENAMLVVDVDNVDGHHKSFADYDIWGNELGANFTFREDLGMFFPVQYYKESVLPLFSLRCGVGCCPFDNEEDTFVPSSSIVPKSGTAAAAKSNSKHNEQKRLGGMKALMEHLRMDHGATLCFLCIDGKRDFVSNLRRFSPSQLNNHLVRGDGAASGFTGHPACKFCKPKRFYDLTKLHEHLNMEHYKCHICEKQGRPNQFFKGYQQLCIHFNRDHFLCPDPQCIAARFVVFENEIDFRAHELSVHGTSLQNNKKSAKLLLQFRVHRSGYDGSGIAEQQEMPSEEDFQYGLDGEAFVPDDLPNVQQQNEPVMTNPVHAARTAELRAQAQIIREQQRLEEEGEAFPSLQESSSKSQQQSLVGWTTNSNVRKANGGPLQVEDFPALSSRAKPVGYNPMSNATTARVTGFAKKNSATANWASCSSSNISDKNVAPPVSTTARSSSGAVHTSSSSSSNIATRASYSAPALTSDNFPSLATLAPRRTKDKATRYTAAAAFSKQIAEGRPSSVGNGFPPLSSPVVSFNNSSTAESVKEQIDKIKVILGPASYSKLKSITKEFANGFVRPQEFVDYAASLFKLGVKDPDFLSFLPNLIYSCPQNSSTARALAHLDSLVQVHPTATNTFVSHKNDSDAFPSMAQSSSSRPEYANIALAYTKKKSSASTQSSSWSNTSQSAATSVVKKMNI